MREIKFRAWNKAQKHMIPSVDVIVPKDGKFEKHLIPMQATGKLGTKGKNRYADIYDGDIIRFYFQIKHGRVLEFVGRVIWDEYMWLAETKDGDQFSLNRIHNCIILGNIHEDLNLLKQ